MFLKCKLKEFHCRYCRKNKVSIVVLLQQKFTRQYAHIYVVCTCLMTHVQFFFHSENSDSSVDEIQYDFPKDSGHCD